jgi:hypothetical protein
MRQQFAEMYPNLRQKDIDRLVKIEQVLIRSKSKARTDFQRMIAPAVAPALQPAVATAIASPSTGVTLLSTLARVEDASCDGCE